MDVETGSQERDHFQEKSDEFEDEEQGKEDVRRDGKSYYHYLVERELNECQGSE